MLEASDATHFDEELVRLAVQELVDEFDGPTVPATKLCEASLKASSSRRESASSQKLSSYTSQWWCYAGWLSTTTTGTLQGLLRNFCFCQDCFCKVLQCIFSVYVKYSTRFLKKYVPKGGCSNERGVAEPQLVQNRRFVPFCTEY